MGCHFLLQRIFPTQGLNLDLPYCRQMLYCLSHQGSLFIIERILVLHHPTPYLLSTLLSSVFVPEGWPRKLSPSPSAFSMIWSGGSLAGNLKFRKRGMWGLYPPHPSPTLPKGPPTWLSVQIPGTAASLHPFGSRGVAPQALHLTFAQNFESYWPSGTQVRCLLYPAQTLMDISRYLSTIQHMKDGF